MKMLGEINRLAPIEEQKAQYMRFMQKLGSGFYSGEQREFSLLGETLVISKEMDVFNYYRNSLYNIADFLSAELEKEFYGRVNNLDTYLAYFPEMYLRYREPLIALACDILLNAEVYDVPHDTFTNQHNEDFCLCKDDMQVTTDSFNMTIEANQRRIANNYNMMPGLIFNGIGGIFAAAAVNVAVSSISEAQIKNANVSQSQRRELYGRIHQDILMKHVFADYWRVFLSLTWWMNKKGCAVWYPDTELNQKAAGLFENLKQGRLPAQKTPKLIMTMLQAMPYTAEYYSYLISQYGETEEIRNLKDYFGYLDLNNSRMR